MSRFIERNCLVSSVERPTCFAACDSMLVDHVTEMPCVCFVHYPPSSRYGVYFLQFAQRPKIIHVNSITDFVAVSESLPFGSV